MLLWRIVRRRGCRHAPRLHPLGSKIPRFNSPPKALTSTTPEPLLQQPRDLPVEINRSSISDRRAGASSALCGLEHDARSSPRPVWRSVLAGPAEPPRGPCGPGCFVV